MSHYFDPNYIHIGEYHNTFTNLLPRVFFPYCATGIAQVGYEDLAHRTLIVQPKFDSLTEPGVNEAVHDSSTV